MHHGGRDCTLEGGTEVLCQLLGEEHRAVLPASAAEAHIHEGELSAKKVPHCGLDERDDGSTEFSGLWKRFQELSHACIETGLCLEALFAPGIRERAAVEDETAAVAPSIEREEVWRKGLLEREAGDLDGQDW